MVLKLLKFYKTESDAPAMKMLTMAAISGVSSGVLLAMANSAAELAAEDADISLRIFFMFAIALLLFIYSKKLNFGILFTFGLKKTAGIYFLPT